MKIYGAGHTPGRTRVDAAAKTTGAHTETWDLKDDSATTVPDVAALVLGSPEFQKR